MAKDTLTDDTVIVKAGTSAAAATAPAKSATPDVPANYFIAGEKVSDEELQRVLKTTRKLEKAMGDTMAREAARIEAIRDGGASVEEAELIFPTLLWNLADVGPIQLGPPVAGIANPSDVNKVLAPGQLAAMIGISFAPAFTFPVPSNMYLLGRPFRARFSTIRLTNAIGAGPSVTFTGNFAINPINIFVWFFVAPGVPAGTTGDLYDVNFDMDLTTGLLPGAGFANSHYDLDSAIALPPVLGLPGLPATGPGWRTATSNRFMVNQFPA